jgi:hypothetical protein
LHPPILIGLETEFSFPSRKQVKDWHHKWTIIPGGITISSFTLFDQPEEAMCRPLPAPTGPQPAIMSEHNYCSQCPSATRKHAFDTYYMMSTFLSMLSVLSLIIIPAQ